jgi:hypothetical protein
VVARIEAAAAGEEMQPEDDAGHMGALSASGQEEEEVPSVTAFDELMKTELLAYAEASTAFGGQVEVRGY